MRRTMIYVGVIIALLSLLLVSINPVVGYVSVENEIEESIVEMDDAFNYIAVPTVYYQIFKELIEDIDDEDIKESIEVLVAEWDYYGYEYDNHYRFPIFCGIYELVLGMFCLFILILQIWIYPTPILTEVATFFAHLMGAICIE